MTYKITDYPTLQELFNAIEQNQDQNPYIDLEGQTINLSEPVTCPFPMNRRWAKVEGKGATIRIAAKVDGILPHPDVRAMRVAEGVQSNSIVNLIERWDWSGVTFLGGENQLVIAGQRGSRIDCRFNTSSGLGVPRTGIYSIFCMHLDFSNSQFQAMRLAGVVLRTGVGIQSLPCFNTRPNTDIDGAWFVAPTTSNSQSNVCKGENCWFFGRPAHPTHGPRTFAFALVHGCDAFTLREPIFEGAAPDYAVYNNGAFSNTVRSMTIEAPHIEFSHGSANDPDRGAVAVIYTRALPMVSVTKPYQQTRHTTFFEADEGTLNVNIHDLAWVPSDANFIKTHERCNWTFFAPNISIGMLGSSSIWSGALPWNITGYFANGIFYGGTRGTHIRSVRNSQTYVHFKNDEIEYRHVKTIRMTDPPNIWYRIGTGSWRLIRDWWERL